jgi:hypothetical protein
MKIKLIWLVLFTAMSFVLTGCTAVQNYSLRSYQGPLPIEDYRYVNPEAYGVPLSAR